MLLKNKKEQKKRFGHLRSDRDSSISKPKGMQRNTQTEDAHDSRFNNNNNVQQQVVSYTELLT